MRMYSYCFYDEVCFFSLLSLLSLVTLHLGIKTSISTRLLYFTQPQ